MRFGNGETSVVTAAKEVRETRRVLSYSWPYLTQSNSSSHATPLVNFYFGCSVVAEYY